MKSYIPDVPEAVMQQGMPQSWPMRAEIAVVAQQLAFPSPEGSPA